MPVTAAFFLANVVPWIHADSQPAYVNVLTKFSPSGGRPSFPGRAFTALDDALQFVQWQASTTDVYVCMSAQSAFRSQEVDRWGRTFHKAKRDIKNVVGIKSFYVDVDVKPDDPRHGYANTAEANTEFARLIGAIGLPPPSLAVASGSGGFHAHWVIDRVLTAAEWLPVATALRNALAANGFRGDVQCIIDVVRILRVPETFNFKHQPPAPVTMFDHWGGEYPLATIWTAVEPYKTTVPSSGPVKGNSFSIGSQSPLFGKVGASDLTANIPKFIPTIEELAVVCPFLEHTLKTGGRDWNEPTWFLTMNIAAHCRDGRVTAHRLSQGHPKYTAVETDEKFDRQVAEKRGWVQCATVGAVQCLSCRHRDGGRSMFNVAMDAARPVPPPVTTQGKLGAALPPGYTMLQMVTRTVVDDKGVQHEQIVIPCPVSEAYVDETKVTLNFVAHLKNQERPIVLPFGVRGWQDVKVSIGNQGLALSEPQAKRMSELMAPWIEQLRQGQQVVSTRNELGWANGTGFVCNNTLYGKGITRPVAVPDSMIAENYLSVGVIDPWLECVRIVNALRSPSLDVPIAASFASPLLSLCGTGGGVISLFSPETGVGKSTSLLVGQTAYGSPTGLHSMRDTYPSTMDKLGKLRHYPMFWDEVQNSELLAKELKDLVFHVADGRGRHKMNAKHESMYTGAHALMMVMASNRSVLNMMAGQLKGSTAGAARVLEINVPPPTGVWQQVQMSAAVQMLSTNYGHAGVRYAEFLGANQQRLKELVPKYWADFCMKNQFQTDERFWSRTAACLILGAEFANMLGLTAFDLPLLKSFLIDTIQVMRTRRLEGYDDVASNDNLLGYLARYLNEKRLQHTVITDSMHIGQGRPVAIVAKYSPVNLRKVEVHLADDGMARFTLVEFQDWMDDQGVAGRDVVDRMVKVFPVKRYQAVLCSGTQFRTSKVMTLELNRNDPKFNGTFN